MLQESVRVSFWEASRTFSAPNVSAFCLMINHHAVSLKRENMCHPVENLYVKFNNEGLLCPCEGEFMKEIYNLIFGFLWKGKDKVKRTAMINDIENGRLKMVDIDLMIRTQKIMCVKRYMDNTPLGWKKF